MTNKEWLLNKMQNMSDEEFAKEIRIPYEMNDEICFKNEDCSYLCCTDCKIKWLKAEHKEKITLLEAERIILENIDKDYKWIVRNKYGHLEVCKDKPEKEYVIWTRHHGYFNLGAFNQLFQFIKWEDSEPYNIEELLKGE